METLSVHELSDDREEGEIIDEYEDVSDCSLIPGSPLNTGKSVCPPEILKGVCLSRTTKGDLHDKPKYYGKHKRRIHHKRRHSLEAMSKKSRNITVGRPSIIEIRSDSEDEIIDPQYAKQLRDALCRESAEASTNNNLKSRLKTFIDNNSPSDDEEHLNALRDFALLSTFKTTQSANINELSRNGVETSDFNSRSLSDSVDPELQELRLEALKSVIIKNHERRKRKATQTSNNTNGDCAADINKENDQTIMNNKRIKIDGEDPLECGPSDNGNVNSGIGSPDTLEEDTDRLRAILLASLSQNVCNKTIDSKQKIPFKPSKVVVKPLIINLNSDSDSESEPLDTIPTKSNALNSTVSEFLKQQRAEVEAITKEEAKTPHNVNKRYELTNKSVMKLLPRSQQLEYHKLKQLLSAHKRVKSRKIPHRVVHSIKKETNQITNSTKKLPFYKSVASFTNNNRKLVNNRVLKNDVEKKSSPTSSHIQSTLDDLQIRKNGRLQMKGKYQALGPLLNNINQASYERQRHEILIKKLLQEIQIARTNLANSHQNFTNLVQQLVKEKRAIDQGALSTPFKTNPISNEVSLSKTEESTNTDFIECSVNTQHITIKEDQELVDPKDINKEFVKQFNDVNVPKYTSPLNYRSIVTDPVTIICPYDLLGVCKDKECPYVHYS